MRLRLGPVLLCVFLAICRAVWLSLLLSGFHLWEIGYLLLADLPVIAVLSALAFVEAAVRRPWKRVLNVLSIVLVTFYVADVLTVFALNARLQLSDLRQFAVEWWLVWSYVSVWSVAAVLVIAATFLLELPLPVGVAQALPGSALVLLLLPLGISDERIPAHLQKYTGSVLRLGKEIWGTRWQPITRYRPSDFAAYRREYEALFDPPIARSGKDIILVVVESLSASDSQRTSGLRDLLPRFDELSHHGMLFRNFFANFEASEGGIVALTSGVPPLHFPTASTNTFREYSLQRSIISGFTRAGYHTEFLTTVPLYFISMHRYARSPIVGFSAAAGQHEIPRYTDAPRFAFESPADHLLYEEVLARLDSRKRDSPQPWLTVLVTASSHPPYVDPLGRRNTERNVWSYVEEELWWLYEELSNRRFFDNGLLLITGDHRKMVPISQRERDRYGDSAKARVPLLVIGAGVPRGVVDDRLFQQSDLLRMLDRAMQPDVGLSAFAVWVERYVFMFGVASNASNVEIFEASNAARQGFRMKLQGAGIEWIARPPNALAIERTIHRQRAMQQAMRAATAAETPVRHGRPLKPSPAVRGMLVGVSTDLDLSRDPDDPRGSLKTIQTESFEVDSVLHLAGAQGGAFTMTVRTFLSVPADGDYWFSLVADDQACLTIDEEIVLGCQAGLIEGVALLRAGLHRMDLRFVNREGPAALRLQWLPPGAKTFTPVPGELLILPESGR